jgi:CTP:molybdopterin cytidylyltransferase MocA
VNVRPDPVVVPIILAAGASVRMGRPKALLDFDGKSALELVLDACAEGGTTRRPIIVVREPADDIRARLGRASSAPIWVVNHRAERGQTSSLRAGLGQLPPGASAFLLFPVDYVLVTAADVRALVQAFANEASKKRIVIPSWQRRRGHPVLIAAELSGEFLALADDGSARDIINAHAREILHVEASSDRVLQDMDTLADYEMCLQRFRSRI